MKTTKTFLYKVSVIYDKSFFLLIIGRGLSSSKTVIITKSIKHILIATCSLVTISRHFFYNQAICIFKFIGQIRETFAKSTVIFFIIRIINNFPLTLFYSAKIAVSIVF